MIYENNKKKKFLFLLAFVFHIHIFSQCDVSKWLNENVEKLTNIAPEKYLDSELSFLKKAIGEKRIVMLGEEGHFDGQTLKAKAKVIKYLHEEMGYEVLLVERGFYEMNRVWQDLLLKKNKPLYLFADLTTIFGKSVDLEKKDLFEYIAKKSKTAKPLRISGFDVFESSEFFYGIESELKELLEKYIPNLEKDTIVYHATYGTTPDYENQGGKAIKSKIESLKIVIKRLEAIESESMIDSIKLSELQFMIQALRSVIHGEFSKNKITKKYKTKGRVTADIYTLRDKYMAENLIWYLDNYYKEKKIIISASTYHISRNVDIIKPRPYFLGKDAIPMGHYLWKRYPDDIYSIAFLCYKGKRGIGGRPPQNRKLPKRSKKGIERKLHKLGIEYGFLNLRKLPNEIDWFTKFYMLPTFIESYKVNWKLIYDGVFFINEMKPPEVHYLKDKKITHPYLPSNYKKKH